MSSKVPGASPRRRERLRCGSCRGPAPGPARAGMSIGHLAGISTGLVCMEVAVAPISQFRGGSGAHQIQRLIRPTIRLHSASRGLVVRRYTRLIELIQNIQDGYRDGLQCVRLNLRPWAITRDTPRRRRAFTSRALPPPLYPLSLRMASSLAKRACALELVLQERKFAG